MKKLMLTLPCLLIVAGCEVGRLNYAQDGKNHYIDGGYIPPESSLWEPVQSYQDAHKDCKEATLKDYPYTVCATRVLEVFKLCKVHPQWGEPLEKVSGNWFKRMGYNNSYASAENIKLRQAGKDCLKQNGLYRITDKKFKSIYGPPRTMGEGSGATISNEHFQRLQQQQIRYANSKVGVKFP